MHQRLAPSLSARQMDANAIRWGSTDSIAPVDDALGMICTSPMMGL